MMDTASNAPTTTMTLLRLLNVNNESALRQRYAIRAWLGDHTPTSALKCSLLANGYGLLLKGY